jgi:hypothetical protein
VGVVEGHLLLVVVVDEEDGKGRAFYNVIGRWPSLKDGLSCLPSTAGSDNDHHAWVRSWWGQ